MVTGPLLGHEARGERLDRDPQRFLGRSGAPPGAAAAGTGAAATRGPRAALAGPTPAVLSRRRHRHEGRQQGGPVTHAPTLAGAQGAAAAARARRGAAASVP